jgi:hypothetical protein
MTFTPPTKWRYGSAGDTYPVRPGEMWRVGEHRFACADITLEAGRTLLRAVIGGRTVDLLYVDPPWDQGALAAFRTRSGVDGSRNFAEFFHAFSLLLKASRANVVCIEMGGANLALVQQLLRQTLGHRHVVTLPVHYSQGRPSFLVIGYSLPAIVLPDVSGKVEGMSLVSKCIAALTQPGALVVDVCCGMGYTPVAAARLGRVFAGGELAPRRLAVALEKVAQTVKQPPERMFHE